MSKKVKSTHGTYGQNKTRRVLGMTDEGWDCLQELAAIVGTSRSEFLERLSRGKISLTDIYRIQDCVLERENPSPIEMDADVLFDCELTLQHMGEPSAC